MNSPLTLAYERDFFWARRELIEARAGRNDNGDNIGLALSRMFDHYGGGTTPALKRQAEKILYLYGFIERCRHG